MNEFVTETKRVAKTADKEETSQRADLKFQVQEKEFGQTFPRGRSRFWEASSLMYLRVRPLASRPNIKAHSV